MKDQSRVNKRMRSMQNFMEIAKYLDSGPPIQAPVGLSQAEFDEIHAKHNLAGKSVTHMLDAIVFEISVKVLWELDHDADCRNTHNIGALYAELSHSSQRDIKEIYDDQSANLSSVEATDSEGHTKRLADLVPFQSLDEALLANADTIRNFKYEGSFKGKSSVMGSAMWDGNTFWTLPRLEHRIGERLPESLYNYTAKRVREANFKQN